MTDLLAPPPADVAASDDRPPMRSGVGGPPWGWAPSPAPRRRRLTGWLSRFNGRTAWLAPLAVLGCVAAAGGYVLTSDPTDSVPDLSGPCVFRELTGLDCPGCGGTRMVWYVLHGDLVHAARYHLFALLMIPLVVYVYAAWTAKRVFAVRLPTWRPGGRFWLLFALGFVAFVVLRNLPFEPFLYFRV